MALTRKRRKELKRLKDQAEELWNDQKVLLDNASAVVRAASQQAAHFAREEINPKIQDTIDSRVRPAISSSLAGARSVAENTRNKVTGGIFPAVTSALGTALGAIEVAKNEQVREAFARVSALAAVAGEKTGLVKAQPEPKSIGFGRYILIGVAVVTAVGVAYAAWQTLRADDDLWVADETETA